jgi:methionine synthase reductase
MYGKCVDIGNDIVCSTTGNGDAPENADEFWRIVKKRTAKDTFLGVPFCVLGLGDTNYDKFCHMGKSIDKRCSELGGERMSEIICADEACNLEEMVNLWKSNTISAIHRLFAQGQEATATGADTQPTEEAVAEEEKPSKNCLGHTTAGVPCGVLTLSKVRELLGVGVDLAVTPDAALLPRSRKACDGDGVTILEGKTTPADESAQTGKCGTSNENKWSVENPFFASVNTARWLSPCSLESAPLALDSCCTDEEWAGARDVAFVEFNISRSDICYQPGDSVAICAPNPSSLVEIVLTRLRALNGALCRETVIRMSCGEEVSLGELLTYRLDLVSVPRKASVLTLSQHCTNDFETAQLQWLCVKGEVGKELWRAFFEEQRVGIGELLALYPSCCPPLHVLISCLSPLAPRAYSIASSPLCHPCSVSIAFSVVRMACRINTDSADAPPSTIRRMGLCTSYLVEQLSRWLSPVQSSAGLPPPPPVLLRIIHKPSVSFRLPGSVAPPLLLIGPGTGVAPFMGFLAHRAMLEKERAQSGDDTCTGMWRGGYELEGSCDLPCERNIIDQFIHNVQPGPVYLFFGCRNEGDWIFRVKTCADLWAK